MSSFRQHTYDLPLDDPSAPRNGDLLRRTTLVRREISWWLVVEARPVESQVWPNRWQLTLFRLPRQPWLQGKRVWPSEPYAPGEQPRGRYGAQA